MIENANNEKKIQDNDVKIKNIEEKKDNQKRKYTILYNLSEKVKNNTIELLKENTVRSIADFMNVHKITLLQNFKEWLNVEEYEILIRDTYNMSIQKKKKAILYHNNKKEIEKIKNEINKKKIEVNSNSSYKLNVIEKSKSYLQDVCNKYSQINCNAILEVCKYLLEIMKIKKIYRKPSVVLLTSAVLWHSIFNGLDSYEHIKQKSLENMFNGSLVSVRKLRKDLKIFKTDVENLKKLYDKFIKYVNI